MNHLYTCLLYSSSEVLWYSNTDVPQVHVLSCLQLLYHSKNEESDSLQ
jgi:hypothetical protein